MADGTETQIDRLGIDISVKENDAAAKISAVAKAINQLRKSLSSLTDVSKQMNKLTQLFSSIKVPTVPVQKPKGNLGLTTINVEEVTSSWDKIGEEVTNNGNSITTTYEKIENGSRKVVKVTDGMATSFKDFKVAQGKVEDNTNKLTKSFKKFTKSIGRVAFYRMIRTVLKEIVQAAREGLANIRTEDSELNDSMNKLSQSATTLKNAFAQLLSPIIKTIEPIITKIADSIAVVVNRIEEAKAALSGQDTYTKILTSDTEEYQEAIKKAGEESKKQQGNLLSFDTFTTQNARKSQSTYTGVKTEEVSMTQTEAAGILAKVNAIKDSVIAIAGVVAGIKLVSVIAKLKQVADVLGGAKGIFSIASGIAGVVGGIVMTVKGILNILNWDEETTGMQKFLDVLTVVLGVVSAIAGVIALTKAKTLTGMIAGGVAIAGVIGAIIASSAANAQKAKAYAFGGEYDRGDFFMANENGKTELVASSNTGGGSVMNIEQWEKITYSSFYRALSDYDAAQNGQGGGLDINSLGRTIAGNSGFVNEMNRRNSSLNLI